MKHKHAELIKAWADGAEIEWQDFKGEWKITKCPHWFVNRCYRIKPPEVARWRKDMAQALKDGKVVEHLDVKGWRRSLITLEEMLDPTCDWFGCIEENYRTRPEPKPDVVRYGTAEFAEFFDNYRVSNIFKERYERHNLKLTWDGETGALKSSEVLK